MARRSKRRRFEWEELPARRLLDVRLCDLGVRIEGTWLEEAIARVREELDVRGLARFRPHFWLSDEWFSPAGVPGVAVPFYLAHPRLLRLERRQMLEAEGGTRESCLKLLRHEAGHALHHAYELHRRRRWQRLFGKSSLPYPEAYRPNPASRRFVQHLGAFYAQSHPDEDFAETFAVWLRPGSNWRRRYATWPALGKLEYVDGLMGELAGRRPLLRSRARPDSLPRLSKTLREHYAAKHELYAVDVKDDFDRELTRIFTPADGSRAGESAARFLRRHRREIRQSVSRWTGEYQFILDQVLAEMIARCRHLELRARGPERRLKLDFAILLTVRTMHTLYRGRLWHRL